MQHINYQEIMFILKQCKFLCLLSASHYIITDASPPPLYLTFSVPSFKPSSADPPAVSVCDSVVLCVCVWHPNPQCVVALATWNGIHTHKHFLLADLMTYINTHVHGDTQQARGSQHYVAHPAVL